MIYLVAMVLVVSLVASLTRLATTDRITAPQRVKVRDKYGTESFVATMLECDRCTSYWVAKIVMPFVLAAIGIYEHADLIDILFLAAAYMPSAHAVSYLAFHLLLLEEK
jgi:hypothetical protein